LICLKLAKFLRPCWGRRIVAAPFTGKIGIILFVLLPAAIAPDLCKAQAAPQATASVGSSGVSTNTATIPAGTRAASAGQSPSHLAVQPGPPVDDANRKALEERAGQDAAKLLVRSAPSDAQVYVDGAFVGRSPLWLIVAPGKYKIDMRGPRQESGEQTVGLLPNDTQEIVLALTQRYPSVVSFGK
jgi:PEGA domain